MVTLHAVIHMAHKHNKEGSIKPRLVKPTVFQLFHQLCPRSTTTSPLLMDFWWHMAFSWWFHFTEPAKPGFLCLSSLRGSIFVGSCRAHFGTSWFRCIRCITHVFTVWFVRLCYIPFFPLCLGHIWVASALGGWGRETRLLELLLAELCQLGLEFLVGLEP